jgi:hypothetical protein
MTFATLRALQAIIGDAIDEIYAAYKSEHPPNASVSASASSSSSPAPPSPVPHRSPTPPLLSLSNHTLSSASHYSQSQSSNTTLPPSNDDTFLDFPDLNLPGDPSSPAELLTSRPDVANAISRIVSAASQLAVVVRPPFLTICDASMIVRPISSSVSPSYFGFFPSSIISHPAYASLRHPTSQNSSALLAPQVYPS